MPKYFGNVKNDKANMPQEVVNESYQKKGSAITEGSYVDTQPELDKEFNKALNKVKKSRVK